MHDLDLEAIKARDALWTLHGDRYEEAVVLTREERDALVAEVERLTTACKQQALALEYLPAEIDTLTLDVERLDAALRAEREANERARAVLGRAIIECESLERGEAWWIAARNELGARITVRTPVRRPQEPNGD